MSGTTVVDAHALMWFLEGWYDYPKVGRRTGV